MDAGYAREFDYPHLLLEQSDSVLSGMVAAVGVHESEQLKKIAHDTYMKHHSNSELLWDSTSNDIFLIANKWSS